MTQKIIVPPLGESVTQATVARWLKQVGDFVKQDEPLVELETDKVTLEVNAIATGVLASIDVTTGATVDIGAVLGLLDEATQDETLKEAPAPSYDSQGTNASADKAASADATEDKAARESSTATRATDNTSKGGTDKLSTETVKASEKLAPSVSKMIRENELNPADIRGTGKDDRLLKGDVMEHVKNLSTSDRPLSDLPSQISKATDASQRRVPMSRLRIKIAERLKEAQNTAAMLTTFNEIDMTHVMAVRGQYKDVFEKKHGVKLGFMSFFTKACVLALKEIPAVNAEIDGQDIIYKDYYDIGVAVSAPQGLVVPIVRAADTLTFADIEKTIGHLGRKAKDGKLGLSDLTGGTFTITNGGVFGSLMSTPILNPPQVGILGMHKIQERPMAINGAVVIRPMMYVALTYDHRIIDGREAVTFLVRIKECIENPERLLLDI